MNSLKLVVVGDHAVGKTTLLISHTTQKIPEYIPTAESIVVGGDTYCLGFFDRQPEYDRLRPLSYPQTDLLSVCFSVQSPASLHNIKQRWFPELQHHCPRVPCIVVATQVDLRYEQETVQRMARLGQFPVTIAQGGWIAREVEALKYIEGSAKTLHGVKDVFDETVVVITQSPLFRRRRSIKCIVV
ncbi:cell division control protein 42 [Mycena olivaceomarginata]|nr:cell division control protein 42 [Mycena olivaceomarginata]